MSEKDDLQDRVEKFRAFELPDQPRMMHMGTSYLVNDLWREVERLRQAEIERLQTMLAEREWRPIETAPEDYNVILLYQPAGPGSAQAVGQGHRLSLNEHAHNKWIFQATNWIADPTHWMPLPSPPRAALADGGER